MSLEGVGTLVLLKARPGAGDQLLAYLEQKTRYVDMEKDTTVFLVSRRSDDPDTVYLFEAYQTAQAQDAHRSNPSTAEVKQGLGPYLAEPPQVLRLQAVSGKGLFGALS
ncbi:putative quinol monooxygenase [Microvirga alba]|uniref:Antibiotic biosynthesis monooxygenase n=1 Tax=Microvirga alba TaxID=2791025 RepID=A0A931FPK4_9HYPH|nr:antibiotic biosynthesis monooxygenase [Microvirga alba]MBF9234860.1 antibiotic biosynthesis monooxygenase [Microvirga alba]